MSTNSTSNVVEAARSWIPLPNKQRSAEPVLPTNSTIMVGRAKPSCIPLFNKRHSSESVLSNIQQSPEPVPSTNCTGNDVETSSCFMPNNQQSPEPVPANIQESLEPVPICIPLPKKQHSPEQLPLRNGSSAIVRALQISISLPNKQDLSDSQYLSDSVPLTAPLLPYSKHTNASLEIIKEPEKFYRPRYQSENCLVVVKGKGGYGVPTVQLVNYDKPAILQVFVGTHMGKVTPHMFFQACKVRGKTSTWCRETDVNGTSVIEFQLNPSSQMIANCDCLRIQKERNVDVERKFLDQYIKTTVKKSVKYRMIFRTTITLDDGTLETLQVCSQPIIGTYPRGIPEIYKKSLTSCPANGGLELMAIGKNFFSDTQVIFERFETNQEGWTRTVTPYVHYLQPGHFVCRIPPYKNTNITEKVSVRLYVTSSGKSSDPHDFIYTPVGGLSLPMTTVPNVQIQRTPPDFHQAPMFFKSSLWNSNVSMSRREQDPDLALPPESKMIAMRPLSIDLPSPIENYSPPYPFYTDELNRNSIIKQEGCGYLSESSLDGHLGDHDRSMISENSILSVGNEKSDIDVVGGSTVNSLLHYDSSNRCNTRVPSDADLLRIDDAKILADPFPNQDPSVSPVINPTGLLMKYDGSRTISKEPSVVMQDNAVLDDRKPAFPGSSPEQTDTISSSNPLFPSITNATPTTSVLDQPVVANHSLNLTSELLFNSLRLMYRNSNTLLKEALLAPSPIINLEQPTPAGEQVLLSSTAPQWLNMSTQWLSNSSSQLLSNTSSPKGLLSTTHRQSVLGTVQSETVDTEFENDVLLNADSQRAKRKKC